MPMKNHYTNEIRFKLCFIKMCSVKRPKGKSSQLRKSNEAFSPKSFISLGMCKTIAKVFNYLWPNDGCAI